MKAICWSLRGIREFMFLLKKKETSMVPVDKLSIHNKIQMEKYTEVICHINPKHLNFADEKHLKGQDIVSLMKVQPDPISNKLPHITV